MLDPTSTSASTGLGSCCHNTALPQHRHGQEQRCRDAPRERRVLTKSLHLVPQPQGWEEKGPHRQHRPDFAWRLAPAEARERGGGGEVETGGG